MKTYLIIFFTLFASVGIAQNTAKIDSLEKILKTAKKDTTRIKTLLEIGDLYQFKELNRALEHYEQAFSIAENGNNRKIIARCNNAIGLIYWRKSDFPKALQYFLNALEINQQLNDKRGIANNYNNIGLIYQNQSNYPLALKYYFKSLKIKEELLEQAKHSGNPDEVQMSKKDMAASYNNIGIIYENQSEYRQALDYYFECLKYKDALPNKGASVYNNIGIIYKNQSDSDYIKQDLNPADRYPLSLDYYFKALNIFEQLGYKRGVANSFITIGMLYTAVYKENLNYPRVGSWALNRKTLLDTALSYLNKALEINIEQSDEYLMIFSLCGIGGIYEQKEEYIKASEHYQQSALLADSIGVLKVSSNSYSGLATCYEQLGNHKLALQHFKQYTSIKDSAFNEVKSQQIAEIETKYETEKKEKENELLLNKTKIQDLQLSRRNYIIYGLAGAAVFLLVIGLLIFNQYRLRAKQRATELEQNAMKLEQQLLRSQMNPHFIFNSLNAIQSFLYEHDPEEAGKYLSKFAVLVRLILENSRKEFIPLEKEIKFLEHYLELQRLRFEKEFDFRIEIDPEIDVKTTAIPPMLAQPFIENSLEHGLQHMKTKGQIVINFNRESNEMVFSVEDNGIGRIEAAKLTGTKNGNHESLATKITEERLSILNRKQSQRINMIVTDLKSTDNGASGTKVTFHIPFRYIGFDKENA